MKSRRKPAPSALVTVEQAAEALRVSESTVWRLLRRGELGSVERSGRRLIKSKDVARRSRAASTPKLQSFTKDHPMWKLIGAFKSGGAGPGSSDKYAVLAGE